MRLGSSRGEGVRGEVRSPRSEVGDRGGMFGAGSRLGGILIVLVSD